MEFIVSKLELSKALNTVTSITSSREINAIVSNILIESHENKIYITATDLERSVRDVVPATVIKEGSILLPGKKLAELVKGFRYETMKFIVQDVYKVIVKNGNEEQEKKYHTNIEIMGMSPEEFPIPFQHNDLNFVKISPSVFTEMIRKVIYASSVDDARVVFNGILLEFKNNFLHFVATDGRRLSLIKRIEGDFLNGKKIIIPSKSTKEIIKLISVSSDVYIAYHESQNQVYLKIGDIYFSTKLIEGTYPDYNQVIPKDQKYKVQINRNDFINAIRQAMVFAPEPNKQVQLHFKPNILMIVSSTPELGKIEDGLECNFQDESMVIGFNSNYLLDVLESLDSENIIMTFQSPDAPALFFDPQDENFLAIVMPMKIQD